MKINEDKARELMEALGFPDASKVKDDGAHTWGRKVLTKKLNGLDKVIDSVKEPDQKEYKLLFKEICSELSEGNEISLEDGDADVNEEKPTKPKKGKAKTEDNGSDKKEKPSKPKKEKSDKPKKEKATTEKVETDKLGCRIGSQVAKINAALGRKPKMVKDIAEEVGCSTSAVHTHLYNMSKKGKIEKSDKGYALLPKP